MASEPTLSLHTTHFIAAVGANPAVLSDLHRSPGLPQPRLQSEDSRLLAWWTSLTTASNLPSRSPPFAPVVLTLGDSCGRGCSRKNGCCAGASVVLDPRGPEVVVHTASIGLPPVYVYQGPDLTVLTTAPVLIPTLLGKTLSLDPTGVLELLTVGYPLDHRTLYQSTSLLPPATKCRISVDRFSTCGITITPMSGPAANAPASPWEDGVTTFLEALQSRDLSRSVLSLTAGLDTRAILAALTLLDVRIPTVTLIGQMRPSVDAIIAGRLASSLGVTHETISLDHAFQRALPDYATRASLLSSGLISIAGAHEVFFAEQVRARAASRLSGIAGNQLARCGVEAVRPRHAALSILSPPFLAQARPGFSPPHLHRHLPRDPAALRSFLLTRELPQSLQGLFQIAHTHSTQQVPYADAALALAVPVRSFHGPAAPGPLVLRLRDIRHRFVGEYHHRSFQLATIRRAGPPLATLPINWGWTATGRPSLAGLFLGFRGALDAALAPWGTFRSVRRSLRLEGLHMLYDVKDWFLGPLRDFANDTLRGHSLRNSGVLDNPHLDRLEISIARPAPDCHALTAALDLALALQWAQPQDSPARAAAFGSFGPPQATPQSRAALF